MNNEKYLVKRIKIQTAAFKSSRTSEQGEQSEQTQILNKNELRFSQPLSNPQEQVNMVNKVNKLNYLIKWIDIQTASFKSLRTSEQVEQSEQTKVLCKMNWDSDSCI